MQKVFDVYYYDPGTDTLVGVRKGVEGSWLRVDQHERLLLVAMFDETIVE